MEFQNYASKETSTLITELLGTQSGAAMQQLQAVRDALDAAARALAPPMHLNEEVQALVGRLSASAEADLQRVRDDAHAAIDAARADLQAAHVEREKLSSALAQAEAEAAILRSELQTAQSRAESAEQDLSITVEAHAEVEGSLRRIESELKHAHQAKASVEAGLAGAQAEIERLLAEIEQLRARVERQSADHAAQHAAMSSELAQARDAYRQRDEVLSHLDASRARTQMLERELTQAQHSSREQIGALKATIQAGDQRVQALEHELAQASDLRAHRDAVVADLDARNTRIIALEHDLSAAAATREQRDSRSAAELESLNARIRTLEGELATAKDAQAQRDALAAELDARNARLHTLESDLATLSELSPQRDAIAADLVAARSRGDAIATDLVAARSRVDALEQELASSREQLASRPVETVPAPARVATAAADDQVDYLRGEVERMVSLFDASARAVSEMANASNSTELLTELVKRLSLQYSRVALFRLKGNRLEGERQIGLDEAADMSKLVIPTSLDSMLTRAINSRTVQSLYGEDAAVRSGMPFTGAPTSAVALPIVLQGTTLGVVYADDADMPDSARGQAIHESSVGFARLLVGQVVVLLVRHMHELKTLAELSQYATTLLQEAKEMHAADTQAGKSADVVRARLKENVECASQLYAYRAAMEGTAAAALLDEQILAELQETTPFSRDLAAVIGQMTEGELHITAEAS